MTKEELETEAKEYARENAYTTYFGDSWTDEQQEQAEFKYSISFSALKEGYIASAEPREKQITVLSKHILDLQKDKGNLTDKVRELEQQIEKMKCCSNCKHSRTEYEHCRTNKHEKWEIKEK